jgi:hypothetical protein
MARWLRTFIRRELVADVPAEMDSWPAAGFVDTKIRCFMKPEVSHAKAEVQ